MAYKENQTYRVKSTLKYREKFVKSAERKNNMSQKERWYRM